MTINVKTIPNIIPPTNEAPSNFLPLGGGAEVGWMIGPWVTGVGWAGVLCGAGVVVAAGAIEAAVVFWLGEGREVDLAGDNEMTVVLLVTEWTPITIINNIDYVNTGLL